MSRTSYTSVFAEFLPKAEPAIRARVMSNAREFARSSKLPLSAPLTLENCYTLTVTAMNRAIYRLRKLSMPLGKDESVWYKFAINILTGTRDFALKNSESTIKEIKKRSTNERERLIILCENDAHASQIVRSPIVETVGDFLVASGALIEKS